MNLIVVSELTCNEGLFFRHISMVANQELNFDVLVEAQEKDVDKYFNLLRKKGWYDFVDDFVIPIESNQCWTIKNCLLQTPENNKFNVYEKNGYKFIESFK